MTDSKDELARTIGELTGPVKGILAADESAPTIAKRFQAIGVGSTEENRRAYRSGLLTTPGLGEYINGVILFEETLQQRSDSGELLTAVAERQGIVPGIKVDKGTIVLANSAGDKITQGLDRLGERLAQYKEWGARFAKWRNVYTIGSGQPSCLAIEANAEVLARYAAICQNCGIVPIVEPEVLMDGDHDIERCAEVTEAVQQAVFQALYRHRVALEMILLKPNMVVPGKNCRRQVSAQAVAEHTLAIFRRTVPAAVPGINFLSGGLSPETATLYLNALNAAAPQPWQLSFSYGRALQQPALQAWQGKPENIAAAQQALYRRARLNATARRAEYSQAMEQIDQAHDASSAASPGTAL
jgi:fructose-bisphosphate aldolase class I